MYPRCKFVLENQIIFRSRIFWCLQCIIKARYCTVPFYFIIFVALLLHTMSVIYSRSLKQYKWQREMPNIALTMIQLSLFHCIYILLYLLYICSGSPRKNSCKILSILVSRSHNIIYSIQCMVWLSQNVLMMIIQNFACRFCSKIISFVTTQFTKSIC